MSPRIVGWKEWVELPELRVAALRVKIDSGAKTSALHAEDIRVFKNKKTGLRSVQFLLYPRKNRLKPIAVKVPLVGYKVVRSSTGHSSRRPVIETEIKMGAESWRIPVTLVNRDMMGYRMLVGRSALPKDWLIDVNQAYLIQKKQSKKKVTSK